MRDRWAGYRNLLIPALMVSLGACQAPPPEMQSRRSIPVLPEFREHNLPFRKPSG